MELYIKNQEQKRHTEKEYIDRRMSAVENVMKEQTGSDCRKNVWETISILKKEYPDYSDYVENKLKEFIQRYDTDFFEEIRKMD